MNINDEAIEAAAEGAWRGGNPEAAVTWAELDPFAQSIWRDRATGAIEAAMPAIREAIAQEIEADLPRYHELPHFGISTASPSGALRRAARIVRGGDA